MDFHCLIKVQLGPGAVLYLSARYTSRVAQRARAEAIWLRQSPDSGQVSPLPRKPVLLPFKGARAHLQNINSPGTKRCLLGYLRIRIQNLANDSQAESLKTSITKHSRLLICSSANMCCALSPTPMLHLLSRGLTKVHSLKSFFNYYNYHRKFQIYP